MLCASIEKNNGNIYHYKATINGDMLFKTREEAEAYIQDMLRTNNKHEDMF